MQPGHRARNPAPPRAQQEQALRERPLSGRRPGGSSCIASPAAIAKPSFPEASVRWSLRPPHG
eukprot:12063701-Alexandrium_andersonii.AAC.1